jgi:hypothetical protein
MNAFRKLVFVSSLLCSFVALAHDEGHGPKVTDQPLQGGMVMPVIDKKEAAKGASAALVYKAELVRKEDGTAHLYVYDSSMKALSPDAFVKEAKAKIGPMRKNPKWKSEEMKFSFIDGAFVGKLPKIKVKPYYIDITLTEAKRELLTAFENLD